MPALLHLERVTTNLAIGVQKTTGKAGVWTARIRFPGWKDYKYRTTHIPYLPDYPANKALAREKALERLEPFLQKEKRGITATADTRIAKIAERYLEEIEDFTNKNEQAKSSKRPPIHEVEGGRGYWSANKLRQVKTLYSRWVFPFFNTLKPNDDIAQISIWDLDKFDAFCLKKNPNLSPSTRLKAITEIRHVYRFAKKEGHIEHIPSIKRPRRMDKERRRKELTEETYLKIVNQTRKKYLDENANKEYRDYHYLFHLWIMVLANTGIRPPNSHDADHTKIRWEDLHIEERDDGTVVAILDRDNEKGHKYEAVVMRESIKYWEALKRFQQERDIKSEYVFAHPRDSIDKYGNYRWRKGDSIKSFRGAWRAMLREIGEEPEPNSPQSQRLVPYALRHFFITQRLLSDDNVRIEELAEVTGTSVKMIMDIYYRLDVRRRYDSLTAGGSGRHLLKPVYDSDGYYVGSE